MRSLVLKEFCDSISLHGYSYLYLVNSLFARILWVIVILVMTFVAASFLAEQTNEYFDAGIVTTIDSSYAPLTVSINCSYCLSPFSGLESSPGKGHIKDPI